MFDNDEILRNSEKWHDMTREEKISTNHKKVNRLAQLGLPEFSTDSSNPYFQPYFIF